MSPRLGSRRTFLIFQCFAVPFAALIEFLWLGTRLTLWEISCVAVILVGVVIALTIQFWPAASGAVMYLFMALMLLLRPRGLLGERWERFE